MNNAILCMTATIQPSTTLVSRTDALERLADYKKCIRFYLDQTDLPIYFLENSDYDLSQDSDFKGFETTGRFHLLRVEPHPDSSKGKGFQEFYMLDGFVKNHLEADVLIKVTGRYIVKNITSLIPQLTAPLNIDIHRKMKVAITGFFAVEKSIYLDYFYEKYQLANDSEERYIEHVLYDEIMHSDLKSQTRLLPQNPQYRGVSGSYGASLERDKYKMMLRSVERKLIRSLGIPQFLIEY